jgi:hypothetical protein
VKLEGIVTNCEDNMQPRENKRLCNRVKISGCY